MGRKESNQTKIAHKLYQNTCQWKHGLQLHFSALIACECKCLEVSCQEIVKEHVNWQLPEDEAVDLPPVTDM